MNFVVRVGLDITLVLFMSNILTSWNMYSHTPYIYGVCEYMFIFMWIITWIAIIVFFYQKRLL